MSDRYNRLWGLFKCRSYFIIRCFCNACKQSTLDSAKEYGWEIIKTGLYEEVSNQKIILNKLYGKK